MSTAETCQIRLNSPEEALALFGPEDRYLRLIRETLGVTCVFRRDCLYIDGSAEAVGRARTVIEELQSELYRTGVLTTDFVRETLALPLVTENSGLGPDEASSGIDLFAKAKKIRPRTAGQERYVNSIRNHDLVFCSGPAGCGKTYLAVAMALNALRSDMCRKIVLVRPAVEAGEKIGFLPGDMLAKVNPFLRPLLDALNDMLPFETVRRYMEGDVIEIVPLAFMRGRTLNETFIIHDEAQNTTVTQMKMFLTRMGEGSKIVVTGDATQSDLPEGSTSGLSDAMRRLQGIEGIDMVRLTGQDIVRHRLVREIVQAYEPPKAR
ncbi:MAG: PhoH family protein [Planctomycetaceae bacterium]|nr:PhoH family protein [Planctomycetaceae bacterium]MCB9954013.1 PhoH family protein [Planctomycetaceae bacterium]